MSRKIYNRLSFMAVSWLDESTLGWGQLSWTGAPRELYAVVLTLKCQSQHAELESRHEPGNNQSATPSHPLLLLR